jgi:O-antigen/teichoic acid export membrane protein
MVLVNVLVKPLWIFAIDRNVQITVGHQEYGLYNALMSLTIIFNILLDFGITNYNNKAIASDTSNIESHLPNMIVAKGILSMLYLAIIGIAGLVFQYNTKAFVLLILLGVVQMFNSFLQYLRSNVSAHHDFKIDSILSVLDKVLMIGICSVLLFSTSFKQLFVIEWFVYTQLIAYAISILVALVIIKKRYSRIHFQHFSISEMILMCKKSIPYAVLIFLMAIYMRSDSLMLERLEGAFQNGIYAQAYRILDMSNMFGFLFAGILLPMFARLISNNSSVKELVRHSSTILFAVSLALVAHSVVYRYEIMKFLYHEITPDLPIIYMFVILCFPAFCIMHIFSTLLTANGNIQLLIKIALFGSVVSLGVNFFMIHTFHALGAAITAFIVEWILALIYIFYCVKKFQLQIDFIWIFKFILLFGILFGANLLFKHMQLDMIKSAFATFILL